VNFPVVSAAALSKVSGKYPPHHWPLDQLQPEQAFVIPMEQGRDPDGRTHQYVRVLVHKAGERLSRKFSVNKLKDGSLAVTRIA
jgi:hypothetical protein